MNVADLIIVALLLIAAAHGVTQGAVLQVLSFGGFWGGMALGAALGPTLSGYVHSPFAKAFVSLLSLFGFAAIGGALGRQVGLRAWGALQRLKLHAPDAVLGAVISVGASLMAVWLFALIMSAGPSREVSKEIKDSLIVRELVDHLPPAPSVFSRIQNFISTSPFPQVFAQLEPDSKPVQLPSDPAVQQAVAAAGNATLRIVGFGCGGTQTGSGFVAAPNLVVTNAHVVAGIARPEVQDRAGRRFAATPVLFDPNMDIAVLRVPRLTTAALPMARQDAPRGTGGAIMGYPGGGPFQAGAAAVTGRFAATGRDIYGRGLTERDVYQLQANVRPGNSGGPFVRSNGELLGVVFAASTSTANVGYALTSVEVIPRVSAAQAQTAAVGTGPCTA